MSFPIKNGDFSIAMLVYQRVIIDESRKNVALIWLVDPTHLKNHGVRQLGLLFPIEWKNKKWPKPPTSYVRGEEVGEHPLEMKWLKYGENHLQRMEFQLPLR